MCPALIGGESCNLCWLFDYNNLCRDIAWEVFEMGHLERKKLVNYLYFRLRGSRLFVIQKQLSTCSRGASP
jgi:hypothetical protein